MYKKRPRFMNDKQLKLRDIVTMLEGKVICGDAFLERAVSHGFASDLLSDVLTMDSHDVLWLTGLSNLQTIRTAEMADISQIVLVRDKVASPEMLELAKENHIVLIQTRLSMFRSVGLLYQAGLSPVF